MNDVAESILSCMEMSNEIAEDILQHYGMPRRSGRYPRSEERV
jgi:hypothetical protein